MTRREIIILIGSVVYLLSCAHTGQKMQCERLRDVLLNAIRAESTYSQPTTLDPAQYKPTMMVNVPGLEKRLNATLSIDQQGGQGWFTLMFWRNGRPVGWYSPGIVRYERVGDTLTLYLQSEGIYEGMCSVYDANGVECGLFIGF